MKDETTIKAVGAYGGGVAGSGNVCGALLGGVALISSIYSRASLDEKEDPRTWVLSSKLVKLFEEMAAPCGGINCRDIAGVDWQDRAAVKEYYGNPDSSRKLCIQLVGDTALALGEMLEQEAAAKKERD